MPPSGFVWADDMQDDPAPWSSAPVDPEQLDVVNNADEVATVVRNRLESAAQAAIAERGHFALAIPGGSVMKMLAGTAPPWADKCTLAYVNHKAVPIEDAALSTHEKATKLFLAEGWSGANVLTLAGSADTAVEAERYAAQQLGTLPEAKLPRHSDGMPVFDLMLIGVGDDGHVGSLYPGQPAVDDESGSWVLPVDSKSPGSITLSLGLMRAAKEVLVAACGVSEKAPMGKGAAMLRAIESTDDTPSTFPAVGLRGERTWWVLDGAASSELSVDYAECYSFGGASQKNNVFKDIL